MCSAKSDGSGRVGINAHLLFDQAGYRRAGIHHYIAQLLDHLPQAAQDLNYTVFVNRNAQLKAGPLTKVVYTRLPTQRPWLRIIWEQLVWPLIAARDGVDLLHSMAFVTPAFNLIPAIVTVFDLSFIHYPENLPALRRVYLTSQTRRSCRTARRVVTISESAREDVHMLFDVPMEQIDVVQPGVDGTFFPRDSAEVVRFRLRQQLPSRFILHVGTLQPRKNLPLLLESFARLQHPEVDLVLVGGKGWDYDRVFARVRELNLQRQVRFAGYVSDDDLPLWYNAATVVVFPSVYEGFGMPVVQAMACGTPVVAADTSAIPEVAGPAARLFPPNDASALTEHLATLLDDPKDAETMREQGLTQARRFSWQSAGQKMVAVYRRALAER